VTWRKYLVLAAIVVFSSIGDTLLSRGMRTMPGLDHIGLSTIPQLIAAVFNPWVIAGIIFLLIFMAAYLTALSWADLTYVLPATAVGYFMMALLARFFLHEQMSYWRWGGVLMIMAAVGIVANGPELTRHHKEPDASQQRSAPLSKISQEVRS
jgi:drug/metabolite transporter (DMT)-like permease